MTEIEARARGMQAGNALRMLTDRSWDDLSEDERDHWRYLAQVGDLAVASFRNQASN